MEGWDPRLVHALARHNRVVMFDNAGVGDTQPLPPPLTIDAMADQTSALIETLGLGRPDVLGWSMGGTIAQALAVLHPAQVRRLVLCATYPGTGAAVPASAAAIRAGNIFPSNQGNAYDAFKAAVAEYPTTWSAPDAREAQAVADTDWLDGTDAAGRRTGTISAPTLIADGTDGQLDPVANDRILARLVPGARLVLYPDAGRNVLRFPRRIVPDRAHQPLAAGARNPALRPGLACWPVITRAGHPGAFQICPQPRAPPRRAIILVRSPRTSRLFRQLPSSARPSRRATARTGRDTTLLLTAPPHTEDYEKLQLLAVIGQQHFAGAGPG